MSWLSTLVLSLVEGITEFLPISSTAHLILIGALLQIEESVFKTSFDIVIQLGTILSVIVLYFNSLLVKPKILLKVIIAFIPTGLVGFLFYSVLRNILTNLWLASGAIIIGGIVLIAFEWWYKRADFNLIEELDKISFKQALFLGFCQTVAFIPGVSRSAATILGGLYLGLSRKTIIEFSFLLAVPTMLAASGYDLFKQGIYFSGGEKELLLFGFVLSFLIGILAIKGLLAFLSQFSFTAFGFYRIIFGGVFIWLLLIGLV
ncbi:MAG: undecaprenyl-diphosphate phosphatase [Patescibacteria group bacterium]